MQRAHSVASLSLALLALACTTVPTTAPPTELERRARLVDTGTGGELSLADAVERLARAEVVFFGETHVDATTHALELAVYEGLVEATGGRVVLAMEMFARDAQPLLDAYVAGEIDEGELLAGAEPWSNYATGYRALVEAARARGLPVVGSNVPADLRRKVASGEAEAFRALTEEERGWIARELLPSSEAYWERFVRIVRGHPGQTTDPRDYLYSGQSLWDNTMGETCARLAEEHPGWVVFHVNGRFHTDHFGGTVDQLRARRPGTRIASITATAVEDVAGLDLAARARREASDADPVADIEAFVQARGRCLQDGFHAVRTGRTQRFRLFVPEGASETEPVPLVVWLTRDDVSADDELEYLKLAFEGRFAVAALEPGLRGTAPDLGPGGTWIESETTSEDVSDALAAARETRDYLLAHYPLDAERVVLAGAGTGGTVAAAGALTGDFERACAFDPARFRRLRMWGLPEPGGPRRELAVVAAAGEGSRDWWKEELAAYAPSGLDGELVSGAPRSVVLKALGVSAGSDHYPSTILDVDPDDLPAWMRAEVRSELWGETAHLATKAHLRMVEPMALDNLPRQLALGEVSGLVLPVPEGPFGGTTLLVLPEDEIAGEQREAWRTAWLALDGSDVLAAHGGRHDLRVAVQGGSPSPAEVLGELARKNVLIVPATFCASPAEMLALREELAGPLRDTTAAFLPGLGGRLHLAGE